MVNIPMGEAMSKADDDAAKWMAANSKWQQRDLIKAKESGDAHHINQYGDVVITEKKPDAI